jgi:uncharacterized membrane protein YedE/YeeE
MIRAYFYSFFIWAFIYCFVRADWYVILGLIVYGIPSAIAWIKLIKETVDKKRGKGND